MSVTTPEGRVLPANALYKEFLRQAREAGAPFDGDDDSHLKWLWRNLDLGHPPLREIFEGGIPEVVELWRQR